MMHDQNVVLNILNFRVKLFGLWIRYSHFGVQLRNDFCTGFALLKNNIVSIADLLRICGLKQKL
jgi:hypothetical protein